MKRVPETRDEHWKRFKNTGEIDRGEARIGARAISGGPQEKQPGRQQINSSSALTPF